MLSQVTRHSAIFPLELAGYYRRPFEDTWRLIGSDKMITGPDVLSVGCRATEGGIEGCSGLLLGRVWNVRSLGASVTSRFAGGAS